MNDLKKQINLAKNFATMAFVITILMAIVALKGSGFFPVVFSVFSMIFFAIGILYSVALHRLNHNG